MVKTLSKPTRLSMVSARISSLISPVPAMYNNNNNIIIIIIVIMTCYKCPIYSYST
jgi:hypothetical protein